MTCRAPKVWFSLFPQAQVSYTNLSSFVKTIDGNEPHANASAHNVTCDDACIENENQVYK